MFQNNLLMGAASISAGGMTVLCLVGLHAVEFRGQSTPILQCSF